ncbi:autotransporter outer membrane beta-barrel domain-containing protein [Helicobacter sp. 11S02629-2]|uniref:autotransporter outer membrane beta-barrel domain-containing protein n=1 Tax=Helicobacter sp. 11S02629-2 TaxID=1476195 RepID=UPI000BA5C820|nr:autotransporter outer membrane beta-barrel domain-containing protein [Helicobacter sp. 11S02629-2]PAF44381.1 hypothetical protein BKH40_05660 [Helicobacter sp. 11S02629-2]
MKHIFQITMFSLLAFFISLGSFLKADSSMDNSSSDFVNPNGMSSSNSASILASGIRFDKNLFASNDELYALDNLVSRLGSTTSNDALITALSPLASKPASTQRQVLSSLLPSGASNEVLLTAISLSELENKIIDSNMYSFYNTIKDRGLEIFPRSYNIYLQPIFRNAFKDEEDGISGFNSNSYGLAFGFNKRFSSGMIFGALLGYLRTSLWDEGGLSNTLALDTYSLKLYTLREFKRIFFQAILGYSLHDIRTTRDVTFLDEALSSNRFASQLDATLKLGYKIIGFMPYVSLNYLALIESPYTEKGGLSALSVDANFTQSLSLNLGLTYKYSVKSFTFGVLGEIGYDTLASRVSNSARFINTNIVFNTQTLERPSFGFSTGANVKYSFFKTSSLSLEYVFAMKSSYKAQYVGLKYLFRF